MPKYAIMLALFLAGCNRPDPEERYEAGYDDGYAAGYNTECKIRATLIEGDFENQEYTDGYVDGQLAGIGDCRKGVRF